MIKPVGAGGGEEFAGKLPEEQSLAAAKQVVTQYLQDEHIAADAHAIINNAVQEAIETPADRSAIFRHAQEHVDGLLDLAIDHALETLPEGEGNGKIIAQIKGDLRKEYNIEDAYKIATQEKATAQLPTPFEAAAPKKKALGAGAPAPAAPPPAAPPPAAPGAEGPAAGGLASLFDNLDPKIKETLEKLFGRITDERGGTPPPGPALHQRMFTDQQLDWAKQFQDASSSNLLGRAEYCYERFKASMGVTGKAPGAGKKEEEKAPEGPSALGYLKMAEEEGAPTKKGGGLFGTRGAGGPEGTQGTQGTTPTFQASPPPRGGVGQEPIPNIRDVLKNCLDHFDWKFDKYPLAGLLWHHIIVPCTDPQKYPTLQDQIVAIQKAGNAAINGNDPAFIGADGNGILMFRIFTFADTTTISNQERYCFGDKAQTTIDNARQFAQFSYGLFDWASGGGETHDARLRLVNRLMTATIFDSASYGNNFFYNMWWCFSQRDSGKSQFSWFAPEIMRVFFLNQTHIGGRDNPYCTFGLSKEDLVSLWSYVRMPTQGIIPEEYDIDRAYRKALIWFEQQSQTGGPYKDMANDLKSKIYEFISSDPETAKKKLTDWAMTIWRTPSTMYKFDETSAAKFLEITGYDLYKAFHKTINDWAGTDKAKQALAVILDKLIQGKSPLQYKQILNDFFQNTANLYFIGGGITRESLTSLCTTINSLYTDIQPPREPAGLEKTLLGVLDWQSWASDAAKPLVQKLYESLFDGDPKNGKPVSMDAYKKHWETEWTFGKIPQYLQVAIMNRGIRDNFIKFSDFQPFDYYSSAINSWEPNGVIEQKLKQDILQLLNANKDNITTFFTKLSEKFDRVFIDYHGISRTALGDLCNILKVPAPGETDNEKLYWKLDAEINKKPPPASPLLELYVSLRDAIGKNPLLNLNEWLKGINDNLWKTYPKLTITQAQDFLNLTSLTLGTTRDVIEKAISGWGNLQSEKDFATKLLNLITESNNLAEFSLKFGNLLKSPTFYIDNKGLIRDRVIALCTSLKIDIPVPNQTVAEVTLAKLYNQSQGKNQACKDFYNWAIDLLASNRTLDDPGKIRDLLRPEWDKQKNTFWTNPNYKDLEQTDADFFSDVTKVDIGFTRKGIESKLIEWAGKGNGEAILAYFLTQEIGKNTIKNLNDLQSFLINNYFKPDYFIFIRCRGLTQESLDGLCKLLNIDTTKVKVPQATEAEKLYAKAYNYYQKKSADCMTLFGWIVNLMENNRTLNTLKEVQDVIQKQWYVIEKKGDTFWHQFRKLEPSEATEFYNLTGIKLLTSKELEDSITKWINASGRTDAEKELGIKIRGILLSSASDAPFREELNKLFSNPNFYFQFGGIREASFNDLFSSLSIIQELKRPVTTDLDKKLWEILRWKESATTSETEKALALFLYKFIFKNQDPTTGESGFIDDPQPIPPGKTGIQKFVESFKSVWTWDKLPDALLKASFAERNTFIGITGFQPYEYFKSILTDHWPTTAGSADARLKAALITMLDRNKGDIPNFFKDLSTLFNSESFFYDYEGINRNNLANLCKLFNFPVPEPKGNQKFFVDAYEAAAKLPPGSTLQRLYLNLCAAIKANHTLDVQKWLNDQLWKPEYADLSRAQATSFESIMKPLTIGLLRSEVKANIDAWVKAHPEAKALYDALVGLIGSATSLADFQQKITSTFFNVRTERAYYQWPALTGKSIEALCTALKIPVVPDAWKPTYAEGKLSEAYTFIPDSQHAADWKKLFDTWLLLFLKAHSGDNEADYNKALKDPKNWPYRTSFFDDFPSLTTDSAEFIKFMGITNNLLPIEKSITSIITSLKNELNKPHSDIEKKLINYLIEMATKSGSFSKLLENLNKDLTSPEPNFYYRFYDTGKPENGALTVTSLKYILGLIGTVGKDQQVKLQDPPPLYDMLVKIAGHIPGTTGAATNFYSMLLKQIIDMKAGATPKQFTDWWDANYRNMDSKKFWNLYTLTKPEADFCEITLGLILPPKPPEPKPDIGPVDKVINNLLQALGNLNDLWERIRKLRIEALNPFNRPLATLSANDWNQIAVKLMNIDLTQRKYGLSKSDQDNIRSFFGQTTIPSIGFAIRGPDAYKAVLRLYQDVHNQIEDIKKRGGDKSDLRDWVINDLRISDYAPLTEDDKNTLLAIIEKAT